jgi:hypothetical protein
MIEDSRIITRLHRTYRCMPTLFFVRWIHDAELKPQEKLHFGSRKQQRLFSHCSLASYVKSNGLPYRPLSLSPSLHSPSPCISLANIYIAISAFPLANPTSSLATCIPSLSGLLLLPRTWSSSSQALTGYGRETR